MNTTIAPHLTPSRAAGLPLVRWREVVLFTLLAYSLSWGWDAIWIVPRLAALLAAPITPTDPTTVFGNQFNYLPAMFGPLLAALVMRLFVSRAGLRGSAGLRRPWRYYALAISVPIAFLGVVAGGLLLSGLAHFAPPSEPLTGTILGLLALLLGLEAALAFGEEYGWRGYLLPRLLPLGAVRATLLMGLIWSLWHLPVLLSGVILGGYPLWQAVLVHLGVTVLGSFAYTWLGRATDHSPAIAAAYHGSTNWTQQRMLTFLALSSVLAGFVATGLAWLVIVLLVYGMRWRVSRAALPIEQRSRS